jgi:mannan endo-1,4-beta-mannosidase
MIRFGGQFAKLCFIVVLACLFALGPGSSARASSGFQVSGRFLLDANGNNFVMRGINVPHNWYTWETSSSLQNIKAKGANTVRIVLSNGQSGLWPKDSAGDVANVINWCKANRLICVLEVHDTTAHMTTLAQAAAYWIEIESALMGEEAYVIINIGNEPYGNPSDGQNTSLWINDTKDAIAELRAAGFQHTLMVDGPNWGQDWEWIMSNNAASVFNSDPLRNTVFSIHMYEVFSAPDAPAEIQNYVSSFINAGLPLVIGEFGPFNGGPGADVDAVMAVAQSNGIGYLGWEWSGDGDPQLDMVVNFDPNQLTSCGETKSLTAPTGSQPRLRRRLSLEVQPWMLSQPVSSDRAMGSYF